ncbi:uncharacterized protein V1513DRAFT_426837 [Lipomyces chichibuensis]|uniref:uncharacterized protein n=1 Tax=Lipomyces chichibuensis TaxID=1546026 RepID=UPI0033430269
MEVAGRITAYFAQEDHLVGNHTRAEIIEAHSSISNVKFMVSSAEDNCKLAFSVMTAKPWQIM